MLPSILTVTLMSSFLMSRSALVCSQNQNIEVDISSLGAYIEMIMNDTLGVAEMQREVDQLTFKKSERNGSLFIDQLANTISESMKVHINIVDRLKSSVEASLNEDIHHTLTPCCQFPESKLDQRENFNSKVDLSGMCEIIAPTAPPLLELVSPSVLEIMMENRKNISTLKWQYVATQTGVLSVYPAFRTPSCAFIDPRFRTWYIDTSRTRRINILILLDVSRSMNDQYNSVPLIEIAREAINIIFETLTPDDRVGVIAFNNKARRPSGCFQNTLAFATESNIKYLRSDFVNTLIPSGESFYSVGFENAFELLKSTISQNTNNEMDEDWMIMFITDGVPKEFYQDVDEVYRIIKQGNAMTGNKVLINSFGIGKKVDFSILQAISSQRFNDFTSTPSTNTTTFPPTGMAHLIEDPRMLRNKITYSLITQYDGNSSSRPTFSVPYIDGGGLGLIFTVGLPVVRHDNSLFGVVAVDIRIEDIFKDAIRYDNGDSSYVFVIDGAGYVYTHPLMPRPVAHDDNPEFVLISQLEPNKEFVSVLYSMMAGERGNKTFEKEEIFPIGNVIQSVMITATYYWRAIEGANFSICYVTRTATFQTTLPPENIAPYLSHHPTFRYYRLDFEDDSTDFCRYFYHKSTKTQTLVMFAPRSFKNPFLFPERITSSMAEEVTAFFNHLLTARTPQTLNNILHQSYQNIADYFANGVISDVLWTSFVDELWKNTSNVYTGLRYIGTSRGVVRFYPGSIIPVDFDVTKRIWYELAVANPGLLVMSPPYVDIAGAGNVVSISKTITIPSPNSGEKVTSPQEFGVMGVDFSLDHLHLKVKSLYPNCWNGNLNTSWHCILVDNRGQVILHRDFVGSHENSLPVKHIASYDKLMKILIDMNFISQKRCLDLREKVYRIWYELKPTTSIQATQEDISQNPCSSYFMVPLPGTNVFFIAKKEVDYCADINCNSSDSFCQRNPATSVLVNGTLWGCPCVEPAEFDACANNISTAKGVSLCFPEHSPLSKVSECIAEDLPQCFDPHCENTSNPANCSSMVGCTWCDKTNNGDVLLSPFCASSEFCYNSFQGNHLPGYNASNICFVAQSTSNVLLIVLISVGAVLVIIAIVAGVCLARLYRKRKLLGKQKWEEDEECNQAESVQEDPTSPTSKEASTPSSPRGGANYNKTPRKKGPRVIISVVDSDGSEILRKPVQLIHGGKTYGAPPNGRHLNGKHTRKPRANTTPLMPRLSATKSTSSSNHEFGVHYDDNGRPRSVSAGSRNTTGFASQKTHSNRDLSSGSSQTPDNPQLQQNNFSRNAVARRPWHSRDNLRQLSPNRPNSGYLTMRSLSNVDLAKSDGLLVPPQPVDHRRKSADDILNSLSQEMRKVAPASNNFLDVDTNSLSDMQFSNPHYLSVPETRPVSVNFPSPALKKNKILSKSVEEFRIYL